jgi:ankyrin repeat protein
MELIKGGIPVDAVDNEGYTALHYAVATGHSEIVKYLVEQGANVNAKVCAGHIVRNELKPDNRVETVVVGEYYDTVLDLAVKKNDTKIAEYLKSKGGRSAKEEVKR